MTDPKKRESVPLSLDLGETVLLVQMLNSPNLVVPVSGAAVAASLLDKVRAARELFDSPEPPAA